jgi:hypothetical protein
LARATLASTCDLAIAVVDVPSPLAGRPEPIDTPDSSLCVDTEQER